MTKPRRGHLPNAKVAEASKIVERVKERVMKEKVPVNRIYREETRGVARDTETLESIPTFESIKSALYKSRRDKFGPVPASLEELTIPERLQQLENGESFLLFQSEDNKIVVFGTEKDCATVCISDELFVDATFDESRSFSHNSSRSTLSTARSSFRAFTAFWRTRQPQSTRA